MPDSASFQVQQAVRSALLDITVANGYTLDVQGVYFNGETGYGLDTDRVVEITPVGERPPLDIRQAPTGKTVKWLDLELYASRYHAFDGDEEAQRRAVTEFVADIEKRFRTPLPAPFIAGVTTAVEFGSVAYAYSPDSQMHAGASIQVSIQFRHPLEDPYTLSP